MSNIVYFLGAGCSYNFGYPLTNEIMPAIIKNLYRNDLFRLNGRKTQVEKQQEKDLLQFIHLLYPGLEYQYKENGNGCIPTITEILSLVDHLCFYNIPPHPKLNEEKLLYLKYLINRAITELLLEYHNMPDLPKETSLLKKFVEPIIAKKRSDTVSIITTNYDLSIDYVFRKSVSSNHIDYGIPYRGLMNGAIIQQPHKPLFRYYKLHGSLNWLKCDLCGQYYINPEGSTAHQPFREVIDDNNTCDCNDGLKLKTVLVAPSIIRDIRDSNLLQIWKGAMEALRTADHLIFIGYSLPAEDLAIKSIIMRALNGRAKAYSSIEVVQFGTAAKSNYINLMGKNIKYYAEGLAEYLDAR